MRRRKGLLITMIIIIVLLVVAVVGLVLYKFVFSKNGNKQNNTNQISNNQAGVNGENPIQVGDYVDYVPDKASNYLLTEGTSGSEENDPAGLEQEELKWRILNINDDGTVDIISEEPISTEVHFKGAVGYNNAVYLLNDLCKKQYSNEELGAEARSLSVLDIENNMNDEGIQARDSYVLNEVTYADQKIYVEDNGYCPAIYTELKLDIPNESLPNYKEPTTNSFVKAKKVTFIQTFYKLEDITGDYFESEEYYDIVFNTTNGSWLASRCIDCSSTSAMFGLFTLEGSTISGKVICTSGGKLGNAKDYVRPIVTLSENVEISEVEMGTSDDPRALTKIDESDEPNEDDNGNNNVDGNDVINNEIDNNIDNENDNNAGNNETNTNDLDDVVNDIERDTFNETFTPYEGENISGAQVRSLISVIASSNMENEDHQVEIEKPEEITNNKKYSVEFVYDDNDYIEKTIISEM